MSKPGHGLAWTLTLTAAVLAATAALYHVSPRAAAREPGAGTADWFLTMRMPEITTQHESGVNTMKGRVDAWLRALASEGFAPIRLTDALSRLRQGQRLPERSVVILFSPGYRVTHEIVSPIFRRQGVPAVWLTDRDALKAADRRYPTFHDLRGMRRHAGWDAGFGDETGGFSLGGISQSWAPSAGALALNRGKAERLTYLSICADWLPQELVQRLWAEIPPSGPVALGKALIQQREWGVTRPNDRGDTFDLQAPPSRRGQRLFWLGTQGQNDFSLRLSVRSLTGDLWLQLRYDEAWGDSLDIMLSGRRLRVQERRRGHVRKLAALQASGGSPDRPITLDLKLEGRSLTAALSGAAPLRIQGLGSPTAGRGLIQLYLSGKVRGFAKARGVRLRYAPART